MTTFAAGQMPTAASIESLVPVFARKTGDESIASTTTLQNDDALFCAVAANKVYTVEVCAFYVGNETGDIKFAFTFPTGATVHFFGLIGWDSDTGFNTGGTHGTVEFLAQQNQTSSPTGAVTGTASTTTLGALLKGLIVVGSTAGTLQLQWAQRVSNATSTVVKAGSYMRLDQMP